MKNNFNILFLSHGGGPMPILGDKGHDEMVLCLRTIASKIGKPSAILVVSATGRRQYRPLRQDRNLH
jgi:4,5-DOPA dioxygenase extradiol